MKPYNHLALSTCNKDFNEALFRAFAQVGIGAMEISLSYEDCEALDFALARALSEKYGIALHSLHIPFAPFREIDISNPKIADQTVEMAKKYIARANTIGIKLFVIHAGGEPIGEEERPLRLACAKKSLAALADYASALGCTIAVENLPRSCLGNCSAEILDLLSAHPALRVCFDTNHLLGEELVAFVEAVGRSIVTTHISDYDFINERHWLPGEGSIDWPSLIRALDGVGYRGLWLYELGLDCPWSIERPRDLTLADIKSNFEELMAGKSPTPLGTPKKNIGMWAPRT